MNPIYGKSEILNFGSVNSIAIDGLDGSGKGSCTRELAHAITRRGENIILTEFPQYHTPWGKILKQILYGKITNLTLEEKMAIFALNRLEAAVTIQRLMWQVREQSDIRTHLLFDRYPTSNIITLAYFLANTWYTGDVETIYRDKYWFMQDLDGPFLEMLGLHSTKVYIPTLDPELAMQSIQKDFTRESADIYESEPVQRIAHDLYVLAHALDPRITLVSQMHTDSSGNVYRLNSEEVANQILQLADSRLHNLEFEEPENQGIFYITHAVPLLTQYSYMENILNMEGFETLRQINPYNQFI